MISPIDPEAILLTGRVYDGNMSVIPDAMIELWQVDTGSTGVDSVPAHFMKTDLCFISMLP